jgi:hypothetical protein
VSRTIVLLGAGASRDAGLPLTSQLAQLLVQKLGESGSTRHEVEALNFVYSQMIGYQGEDGSYPLRDVNIETLISAVRLLQHRESHEVAPFVSAWKPGALGFGGSARPYGYASEIERALAKAVDDRFPNGSDLVGVIAQIAQEVALQHNSSVFAALESTLLSSLRRELSNLGNTDYLSPLAALAAEQDGGLDVMTLNYDLGVETMAANAGVTVDRGIDRWVAGTPLEFSRTDGTINLLKLHGSVDWELSQQHPHSVYPPKVSVVGIETPPDPNDPDSPPYRPPGRPWIVVGDREKLATDGPTLDLLHAATRAFADADRLVVVGYSFTDAHVNSMVRNWMAVDPSRTITVIDPAWPPFTSRDVRGELATAYGGSYVYGAPTPPRRMVVFTEPAAVAIEEGLRAVPADPETFATVAWGPEWDEITITWHGAPLDRVSVGGSSGSRITDVLATREERQQIIARVGPPRPPGQSAHRESLAQGETFVVYPRLTDGMVTLELVLEGQDLLGSRYVALPSLPAPPIPQAG